MKPGEFFFSYPRLYLGSVRANSGEGLLLTNTWGPLIDDVLLDNIIRDGRVEL